MVPSSGFWVFVVCCFVMGGTGTFFSVPYTAYVQETFSPEVLGKVFSLWMAINSLAMPIGLLLAGPVSDAVGVNTWFLWSGVAMVGTGLLFRLLTRRYDKETMRPQPLPEGANS